MPRSDVEKESSFVFRNLSYKFKWAGLEFADAPFIGLPTVLGFGLAVAVGINSLWGLCLGVVAAVAIIVIKRGKPDGYLQKVLILAFAPRRLSHKARDTVLGPFPIPPRKKK